MASRINAAGLKSFSLRLAAVLILAVSAAPVLAALSVPSHATTKTAYQPQIEGVYSVLGRNPDGSPYQGQVTISVKDGTAFFQWRIAGQTFHGQGPLTGDTLVIDWGETDPVHYRIEADGSLFGTWARGRASETLRPVK
ncbi:hypothetical protein [Roseibium sp.]|uniref:LIC10280 family protein n=1 Tax=Roseibium sp. TaxID=1936156 RepID=UPI003262EF12